MSQTKGLVSIVIPTCGAEQEFTECIRSILSFTKHPFELITVYNGVKYNLSSNITLPLKMVYLPKNKGWMGGINAARDVVNGEYVLMLNDDTQVLDFDSDWLGRLVTKLEHNKGVGAVGPISNAIMGVQNLSCSSGMPNKCHTTPVLSGCCLLVRRDLLDKVGWLDESLPGGDDLDLSIRIRDTGNELAVSRDVFIYHQYATSGKKLHGSYWDSVDHVEDIQNALAKKHGLKKSLMMQQGAYVEN